MLFPSLVDRFFGHILFFIKNRTLFVHKFPRCFLSYELSQVLQFLSRMSAFPSRFRPQMWAPSMILGPDSRLEITEVTLVWGMRRIGVPVIMCLLLPFHSASPPSCSVLLQAAIQGLHPLASLHPGFLLVYISGRQRILAGEGEESSEFLFSLLLPLFARVLAGTVFLYNHNSYWGALFPGSLGSGHTAPYSCFFGLEGW